MRILSTAFEFIKMLAVGVDPFAVYRAESELKAIGVEFPRNALVAHYRLLGQLNSIVETAAANNTSGISHEEVWPKIWAIDLEKHDESAPVDPRLVNPLGWMLVATIGGLILASFIGLQVLAFNPALRQFVGWTTCLIVGASVTATAAIYVLFGTLIGRRTAAGVTFMVIVIAAICAGRFFGFGIE